MGSGRPRDLRHADIYPSSPRLLLLQHIRMYVYTMYVCMHVCTYVCMYVYTYVHTYVYMYSCMYVLRIYVCMHVCMHECMYMKLLRPNSPPPCKHIAHFFFFTLGERHSLTAPLQRTSILALNLGNLPIFFTTNL